MASENPRRTSPIVVGLLIVIALLLAVIAGGVFFLLQSQRGAEVAVQPPPVASEPREEPAASEPEAGTAAGESEASASPSERLEPIALVRSNFGGVEVALDSIDVQTNTVLMTFSAVNCAPCPETYTDYSESEIDEAFLVEDATQTRYDVVRGTDNAALVNGAIEWLDSGAQMTFSVNFTAPPPGSTVNVFLPNTEPFVGIELESANR